MRRIWKGIVRWVKKARRKVPRVKEKTPIRQSAHPKVSAVGRALSVNPEHFRIELAQGWSYEEMHPHPTGATRFLPVRSNDPHMVLRDKSGVARFTLSYRKIAHSIILHHIQRTRTVEWRWSESDKEHAARETLGSKKFQEELSGVHPSEFLLIHFLRDHRDEIMRGNYVVWPLRRVDYGWAEKIYQINRGLADRYFRLESSNGSVSNWVLDLEKSRTREVLGLPALKKK